MHTAASAKLHNEFWWCGCPAAWLLQVGGPAADRQEQVVRFRFTRLTATPLPPGLTGCDRLQPSRLLQSGCPVLEKDKEIMIITMKPKPSTIIPGPAI